MKKISLTKGYEAFVDDEDCAELEKVSWYASIKLNTVYAYNHHTPMQRVIMKAPKGSYVHHVNGNGLDNRKCNLIITTQQENIRKAKKRKNVTSIYKGVSWRRDSCKWHARISIDGDIYLLGDYQEETDAAIAYDIAVLKYWGEGYPLNIIGGSDWAEGHLLDLLKLGGLD